MAEAKHDLEGDRWVKSDFARKLERELAQRTADLAQRTAERDALAAELAAIKAHDPLAEMWAALAEYQPQADRDGHGESWRAMCSERTPGVAMDASLAATQDAAKAGAWAAAHAQEAIAAIRRAKEAKP
jgi:hypothetical protein